MKMWKCTSCGVILTEDELHEHCEDNLKEIKPPRCIKCNNECDYLSKADDTLYCEICDGYDPKEFELCSKCRQRKG